MLLKRNRRLLIMMVSKKVLVISILCILLHIGESTGASANVSDSNDGTEFFKSDEEAQRRLLDLAEEEKKQLLKEILKEKDQHNQVMFERSNEMDLNEEKGLLENNKAGEPFNESKQINEKDLFEDGQNNAIMREGNKELNISNTSSISSYTENQNTSDTAEELENENQILDGLENILKNEGKISGEKTPSDDGTISEASMGSKSFQNEKKEKLMSQNTSDFDNLSNLSSFQNNVNSETNETDENEYQNEDGNLCEPKIKTSLNENHSVIQNYSNYHQMRADDNKSLEEENNINDQNNTKDTFLESEENPIVKATEQEALNKSQTLDERVLEDVDKENYLPADNPKTNNNNYSENLVTRMENTKRKMPFIDEFARENDSMQFSTPDQKLQDEENQETIVEEQTTNQDTSLTENNNVSRSNTLLRQQEENNETGSEMSDHERIIQSDSSEQNKNDLFNTNYNNSKYENNDNVGVSQNQMSDETGKEQISAIENLKEILRNEQLSLSDLVRSFFIEKSNQKIDPKQKNDKKFDGRLIESNVYKEDNGIENVTKPNKDLTEDPEQNEYQTINKNSPNIYENLDSTKLKFIENVVSNRKGTSIIPPENGRTLENIPKTINNLLANTEDGQTKVPLGVPMYNQDTINLHSMPQTSDSYLNQILNGIPLNIQNNKNDLERFQNDQRSTGELGRLNETMETQNKPHKSELNFTEENTNQTPEEQETQLERYPVSTDDEITNNYVSNDTNENELKEITSNSDTQDDMKELDPLNNDNKDTSLKNSSSNKNQIIKSSSLPSEDDGGSKVNLKHQLNNGESTSVGNVSSIMTALLKNYNNVLLPVVNSIIYGRQPEDSAYIKITEQNENSISTTSSLDNNESDEKNETREYKKEDSEKTLSEGVDQGENTSARQIKGSILNINTSMPTELNIPTNNVVEINDDDLIKDESDGTQLASNRFPEENSRPLEDTKKRTITSSLKDNSENNIENKTSPENNLESSIVTENNIESTSDTIPCYKQTETCIDKNQKASLFSHFPPNECVAELKIEKDAKLGNIENEETSSLDDINNVKLNRSDEGVKQISPTGNNEIILNNNGYETNMFENETSTENSTLKCNFDDHYKGIQSSTISKAESGNVEAIHINENNNLEGNDEKSDDLPVLTETTCIKVGDQLTINEIKDRNKSEISCFLMNKNNLKNKTQGEHSVSSFRNSLFNKPSTKDNDDSLEEDEEIHKRKQKAFNRSKKENPGGIVTLNNDSENEMFNVDSIVKINDTNSNTGIASTDEVEETLSEKTINLNSPENKRSNNNDEDSINEIVENATPRNNTSDSQDASPKSDIITPKDITRQGKENNAGVSQEEIKQRSRML